MASEVRQRNISQADADMKTTAKSAAAPNGQQRHPGGPIKHGLAKQALRMVLFALYFFGTCVCIFISQLLGSWLYFVSKDYYYAYMALTKQHFGLLVTTTTEWWSPTVVRVSGDKSVRGQLRKTDDGRLETFFPERLVLIANHQLYTDWLYLWWSAYTARMHGHLFIILKESLRWAPLIGQGMLFYGFIFVSRNWTVDKLRFGHRLRKLSTVHSGPMSGSAGLDPMWLLIFPEGTNLSRNTRDESKRWADKNGLQDMRHQVLPRTTGLLFCLQELRNTVDWVYDCTMAYEGIPRDGYGSEIFTLRSTYFQGRPPKSVNLHWRRFAMSSIPLDDPKAFELWLRERWVEKDALLEQYVQTGRFPADDGSDEDDETAVNGQMPKAVRGAGHIETEVRLKNPLEFLQIFAPEAALAMLINLMFKFYRYLVTVVTGGRY